jgi:hypothetical protein
MEKLRHRPQFQGIRDRIPTKKSRTFLDGKQVTVQSMERDGNKIEDKYVDNIFG